MLIFAIIITVSLILLWIVYALLPTLRLKYATQRKSASAGKTLYLTFDDGPHPPYTNHVLDLLAAHNVQACFFVLTERAAMYPELVRRMADEGHQIALHGTSHENLWFTNPLKSRRTLNLGLADLKAQGAAARYYRPPYGNINLSALSQMHAAGLKLMLWDVMVGDWRHDSTSGSLAEKLLAGVQPGSIICLHDGSAGAAAPGAPARMIEALSIFIPAVRSQGYSFGLPEDSEDTYERTAYRI